VANENKTAAPAPQGTTPPADVIVSLTLRQPMEGMTTRAYTVGLPTSDGFVLSITRNQGCWRIKTDQKTFLVVGEGCATLAQELK
jgi:hypothetical protein